MAFNGEFTNRLFLFLFICTQSSFSVGEINIKRVAQNRVLTFHALKRMKRAIKSYNLLYREHSYFVIAAYIVTLYRYAFL